MKGVYCLIIQVEKTTGITVGALGPLRFEGGRYVYVGSAQAGIENRLQRHFRREKIIRWHIDHLLAVPGVVMETALCKSADKEAECQMAETLKKRARPVNGFGASDCLCISHLFALPSPMSKQGLARLLAMTHEINRRGGIRLCTQGES